MNTSNDNSEPSSSRRHFLASVARMGLLGAMGTYFVTQRIKFNRLLDDPECIIISTCQKCVEFGGCELPKSEHARAIERLQGEAHCTPRALRPAHPANCELHR